MKSFAGLKAWFSKSVTEEKKHLWVDNGGLFSRTSTLAKYLFSDDATCEDTMRVFQEARQKKLVVFKSTWIDDNVGKDPSSAIENYILLPVISNQDERSTPSTQRAMSLSSPPPVLYVGDNNNSIADEENTGRRKCLSPIEINQKLGKQNINHFSSPQSSKLTTSSTVIMTSPPAPITTTPLAAATANVTSPPYSNHDVIDIEKVLTSPLPTLEQHRSMIQRKQQATSPDFLYGSFAGFPHLDDLIIPKASLSDFFVDRNGCQVKLKM